MLVEPRDERALLPVASLTLDDRSELHEVVDRDLASGRRGAEGGAGLLLEGVEQHVHDLVGRGVGPEEVGIRVEVALERRLRVEPREDEVVSRTHDGRRGEVLGIDLWERFVHRHRDLRKPPALDDPERDLVARRLLEEHRHVARAEGRRHLVCPGLQRVLSAALV